MFAEGLLRAYLRALTRSQVLRPSSQEMKIEKYGLRLP